VSSVSYADAEPNGLASMLGALIEANLTHHPHRDGLLRPAVIELHALDADTVVTLEVDHGAVRVANGTANGRAHVVVRAGSRDLIELASTPLLLGMPDPLSAQGRDMVRKLARRHVRIDGVLRHPGKILRLNRLLSVDE
jgi:hypothetical protein